MALTYGLTFLMWLLASFVMQVHLLPMAVAAGSNPFQAVVGMWIAFALLSTLLSTRGGASERTSRSAPARRTSRSK